MVWTADTWVCAAGPARDPREEVGPVCPLSARAMRPWMHVPIDAMRDRPNRFAQLYWSEASGYGRIHPLPSAEQVDELYRMPGYYTHTDAKPATAPPRSFLDKLRERLALQLDAGRPISLRRVHALLPDRSHVCDLGSGSGQLAEQLAALGYSVVAVDPDPKAAAAARKGVRFFAGSAEQLPAAVRAQQFHAVVLSHVLEHARDPDAVLNNAYELLAPGGLLLCEVPNNEAEALHQAGCSWPMLDAPRHLHFFTARSLRAFCERAGFVVRSTNYAYYSRQFTNAWIARQSELHSALSQSRACQPAPARGSKLHAWRLLARTALAAPEHKYDSIGVVASRPD